MNKITILFFSTLVLFGLTLLALDNSKAQEDPDQSISDGQSVVSIGGALVFLPITIGGTGSPVTPTNTPQTAATATNPPAATATASNTPVPAATASNTPVPAATASNTAVPAATASNTPVPTATQTATAMATATQTATAIPTATATATSSVLSLPASPYNYSNITLPAHFMANEVQNLDNTPNNNPVTDYGATLGRVLFYDKNFSLNNTKSCGSCHLAEDGFSDPSQFSVGFEGGVTGRNSMGLANARYYNNGRFFWDERAETLEEQTLMPIQDPIELGMTLDGLVTKLQGVNYYPKLFEDAFGDSTITSDRISLALAQFIRSMVSYQAKYDVGLTAAGGNENQNFANFTAQENRGKQLFFANRTRCSDCHEAAVFVGDRPRNNGLDATTTDAGEGGVNGNQNDEGKFKVPSLRNIELTGPYMHDGRFATLEEVIEHYNSGVEDHPNLDNRLRQGGNNGTPRRLNLSDDDKAALVAFLKTLTDETMINDVKFSDPFTP